MKRAGNSGETQNFRADVVEILTRLLAKQKGVTPGRMFGFPAFYTGRKLFACVYGEGVAIKLPQDMIRKLEGKPGITPFQPYGMAAMREWIQITRDRAEDYAGDAALFDASFRFVSGKTGRRSSASRPPRRAARAVRP